MWANVAIRGVLNAKRRPERWRPIVAVLFIASLLLPAWFRDSRVHAGPEELRPFSAVDTPVLSPFWAPAIQRWAPYIGVMSEIYGFHPDFIAAVIRHESDETYQSISQLSAPGLGGVMPLEPGSEWGSSAEELLMPGTNLRWGLTILGYVVRQSGGDLFTALAAYNGGWEHINSRVPREYAARVLDSYGRALVARAGLSPDLAGRWTVAIQIRAGNVPFESLLVLGDKSIAGTYRDLDPWRSAGVSRVTAPWLSTAHTIYSYGDGFGHNIFIRGYVVPIGLSELAEAGETQNPADALEGPLRARLGDKSARNAPGNPRVLLACLPSLTRLRGQVATRWYAPSDCPAVGRQ